MSLALRQAQAFAYFVGQGWTREQSAGIVANLSAESGLRPDAVGDGGAAYGLAQWHPDRQAGFRAILGKDIRGSTLEEQLAFVHAELRGAEKVAGDALSGCTSAAAAGATVSTLYERPADREGEATRRAGAAEAILAAQIDAGGEISPAQPLPYAGKLPETPMPLLALLPVLAQILPQLAGLFGGAKDARNMATIGKVLDTVVGAAGQVGPATTATVGAAIDAMHADPALVATVTKAVVTHPDIMPFLTITEIGGGIAAAREADAKDRGADVPFYRGSAVFYISLVLLPMVFWYVGSSIAGGVEIPAEWPWYAQMPLKLLGPVWDAGARVGLANLVVGMVLGGIVGVYFGVSVTQAKPQQQQAAQQSQPST
jgi:hypothetical protein